MSLPLGVHFVTGSALDKAPFAPMLSANGRKVPAMTSEAWLFPTDDGLSCTHDWSKKVPIPREDLPAFVKGPAFDVYCVNCGVKQGLKHRIAMEIAEPVAVQAYKPPVITVVTPPDIKPIPIADIRVKLDLEKFGKRYDNNRAKGNVDKAVNVGDDPRWTDAMAAAAEEFAAKA